MCLGANPRCESPILPAQKHRLCPSDLLCKQKCGLIVDMHANLPQGRAKYHIPSKVWKYIPSLPLAFPSRQIQRLIPNSTLTLPTPTFFSQCKLCTQVCPCMHLQTNLRLSPVGGGARTQCQTASSGAAKCRRFVTRNGVGGKPKMIFW